MNSTIFLRIAASGRRGTRKHGRLRRVTWRKRQRHRRAGGTGYSDEFPP